MARENYRFSEEELKQKHQAIDEQLSKLRQQLEQAKDREELPEDSSMRRMRPSARPRPLLAAGGRPKLPLEQLLKEQKRQQVIFENATIGP